MTDERSALETLHFVLCPSFHGATLLAVLLNNHPDIVTLGDTNPTRAYDQICACERLVSECPFWQEVATECRTARFADGAKMLPTLPRIVKHEKLNKAINLALGMAGVRIGPGVWGVAPKPAREFIDTWDTFRNVAKRRGHARLTIDGEKSIAKFLAIKSADRRDVKVIHITRDPRAFVNSCRKHHSQDWRTAVADWKGTHRRILMITRPLGSDGYLRIRYEDLARQPATVMNQIFDFLDVPKREVCHEPNDPEKHHLMGNKMLREFDGEIRYDTAWRTTLSQVEQKQILEATEPLCSQLGYPLND